MVSNSRVVPAFMSRWPIFYNSTIDINSLDWVAL